MKTLLGKKVAKPTLMSTYPSEDVTFLLKDLSDVLVEREVEDREESPDFGKFLPTEYEPSAAYLSLFYEMLGELAGKVALSVGTVSEMILARNGQKTVLASLRSAGTPAGVLIRRYLKMIHNIEVSHYSHGLIKGLGIDRNALTYMVQQHPDYHIQFVDSWTGKGASLKRLIENVSEFNSVYNTRISGEMAALADPGHCVSTFGTRDDFLIPNALLNSHVNGLISRTVVPDEFIGPDDFYGAKFYKQWIEQDVSNLYVDTISSKFMSIANDARNQAKQYLANPELTEATWRGIQDIKAIQERFAIEDMNLVKPGVGETTRFLLKRAPSLILVKDINNPYLKHVLQLAEERGVRIEVYPDLTYSCCGIVNS